MQKTAMIIATLFFLTVAPMHVVTAMDNQETEGTSKTVPELAESKQDPEDPVQKACENLQWLKEARNCTEHGEQYRKAYARFGKKITRQKPISVCSIETLCLLQLTSDKGNILEPARKAFEQLKLASEFENQTVRELATPTVADNKKNTPE